MDGEAWLSRKEAAAHLTALGFPVDFRMLTQLAARGAKRKGPPLRRFLGRIRYEKSKLEAWARAQCEDVA